jgi:hypothetical protein
MLTNAIIKWGEGTLVKGKRAHQFERERERERKANERKGTAAVD